MPPIVYDDEVQEYLNKAYQEKVLFKTGKKVKKEDIEKAMDFLRLLTNDSDDD